MKSILNFTIALVALFTFGTASAQKGHFVGTTCIKGNQVCFKIAGLGNNELITITIKGEATCCQKNNPGVQHEYSKTISARTDKNGSYSTCIAPAGRCPGGFNACGVNSAEVCFYKGTKSRGEQPIDCADAVPCN